MLRAGAEIKPFEPDPVSTGVVKIIYEESHSSLHGCAMRGHAVCHRRSPGRCRGSARHSFSHQPSQCGDRRKPCRRQYPCGILQPYRSRDCQGQRRPRHPLPARIHALCHRYRRCRRRHRIQRPARPRLRCVAYQYHSQRYPHQRLRELKRLLGQHARPRVIPSRHSGAARSWYIHQRRRRFRRHRQHDQRRPVA